MGCRSLRNWCRKYLLRQNLSNRLGWRVVNNVPLLHRISTLYQFIASNLQPLDFFSGFLFGENNEKSISIYFYDDVSWGVV